MQALRIRFQEKEYLLRWTTLTDEPEADFRLRSLEVAVNREMRRLSEDGGPPPEMKCESLGPGLLSNEAIAQFWDGVALTEDEKQTVRALRLALGGGVDRVAMIGDDASARRRGGRRAVVKLEDYDRPVPLRSLGDGALRILGVALGLANARDGFLLIDEAENGLHHSIQPDFWRMVFQTAEANNVQVIATTHSFDCVRGFAQAAVECEDVDGVVVRLTKRDGPLRAVEYFGKNLRVAAEQDLEVR